MNATLVRPAEVTALSDALAASANVRVPLRRLWAMWATAAPRLVGDPAQAAALSAALDELAARGLVQLPVTAWDSSTTPPLPRSVIVPTARRPDRDRQWTRFPWCSDLGWVASLPSLSDARFADLVAINEWLATTRGEPVPVLPMRYRSALLFGDEKHLDNMIRTDLFAPGRLTLDLLACIRIPPPLAAAPVGAGPDILVVENSDTYWAAVEALRHRDTHRVGAVAWGSGRAFPTQVTSLQVDVAGRGPVTGTIWYWGDLDPIGLDIAVAAADTAHIHQAPPVRPAIGLWAAMADRPVQSPGTVDWSRTTGQRWLGPDLWNRLAPVRASKARVPQEAVPPATIAGWAETTTEYRD